MKTWIIAMPLAVALSAVGASGAFAQAGSTGGTLGNTDKSISGERREEPPTQHKSRELKPRAARKADTPEASGETRGSSCNRIVGTWKMILDIVINIRSNGTASSANGLTATWTCKEGRYNVVWSNGFTDHVTISADGNSADVVNNIGYHGSYTRF
jgi:hypothetical protein